MMNSWRIGVVAALIAGAAAMLSYPSGVSAQAPQDQQMFNRHMESRIDAAQMQIRRLRDDLDGGEVREDTPGSGGHDSNAGLRNSLEALDKQCRELERELRRMGITGVGTPYDIYERQRRIEYGVYTMERQLKDMRRWIRPTAEDEEPPADDGPAQPTEPQDGISDEDWASEWANSGD